MNTTPSRTTILTSAIGAVAAGVAVPALLLLGAGTAQADTPPCNLPQVHWPAACTDQIATPQGPSAEIAIPQAPAAPKLSKEWFRAPQKPFL